MAISRKDFIGAVTGRPPRERLGGTLAALAFGADAGAHVFRVHDVAEAADFLAVRAVLRGEREEVPADARPSTTRYGGNGPRSRPPHDDHRAHLRPPLRLAPLRPEPAGAGDHGDQRARARPRDRLRRPDQRGLPPGVGDRARLPRPARLRRAHRDHGQPRRPQRRLPALRGDLRGARGGVAPRRRLDRRHRLHRARPRPRRGGPRALPWIEERFAQPADLRIFVLHHHLLPVPGTGRERNIVHDAGDTLECLQRAGVNLVLCGHKHVPYAWRLEDLFVVNAGTVSTLRLRGKTKPCYNVVERRGDRVRVCASTLPRPGPDPRVLHLGETSGARRALSRRDRPHRRRAPSRGRPRRARAGGRASTGARRAVLRRGGEARPGRSGGPPSPLRPRHRAPRPRRRPVPAGRRARGRGRSISPTSRCSTPRAHASPASALDSGCATSAPTPDLAAVPRARPAADRRGDRDRQADRQDRGRRTLGAAAARGGRAPAGRLDGSRRPAEPQLSRPPTDPLPELLELARAGRHAASDYLEDAALAGVPAVGCRRCGEGLAGGTAHSNVRGGNRAGAVAGPRRGADRGQRLGRTARARGSHRLRRALAREQALAFLGPFRLLRSDLVVMLGGDWSKRAS